MTKILSDKLLVSERFFSIQGEGKTSGVPAYFIRLSQCNLNSIGMMPSRRKPKIWTPKGSSIRLDKLKPDDVILAYDEQTGTLAETKVKAIFRYDLVEYYEIKFDGKPNMYVSGEHPFLTSSGWKKTSDLVIGDEIMHFDISDKMSFKMKNYNPMSDPKVAIKKAKTHDYIESGKKVSKKRLDMFASGTLEPQLTRLRRTDPNRYDQIRKQFSDRMKVDNPMFDPEVVKKSNGAHNQNQHKYFGYHSKTEYDFHNLCKEAGFPLEYVGNYDHPIQVSGSNKLLHPDFILPGTNRVFEIFHTGNTGSCHFVKGSDYEPNRKKMYLDAGYHCTFVDFTELTKSDIKDLIVSEIQAQNGIKIVGIKKLEDGKYPSTKKKPIPFYDITCFPHHTFIVDGLVTHNCGSSIRYLNSIKKGEITPDLNEPYIGDLETNGLATWSCDTTPVWLRGEYVEFQDIIDDWKKEGIYEDICSGLIHIIWTGGEPTIKQHQESIVNFNKYLLQIRWSEAIKQQSFDLESYLFQEIETNGTVYINDELFDYLTQINCSPKLSNSGEPEKRRIVPDAISRIMEHSNYQFKFVISNEDDIQEMFDSFIVPFNIPLKNVVCMPALTSQKDFFERTKWCMEMGKKYKFTALTRLHVASWDALTGV